LSFPRYSTYRDSRHNWLGDVPEHWDLRRLGYYFGERREKVSDRDYQPLSVTKDGIVPQLETAAKTDDGDNRKKVCKGDFVINTRSDRKGSAGLSDLDGSVSLISTVLKPKESVHGTFIHHLLRSVPFQEEFYRFGKGIVADLWSTNYAAMSGITLAMPPHREQVAIAAFLNRETAKIDALIAEQQRLIELLHEKRQAVISHAVTKGLNPDVPMKESGVEWLGEVPAHWSNYRLKALFSLRHGYAFDGSQFSDEGEYALMTPGNFVETGGFRRKDPEKYYVGLDVSREFILQGGEMLIAMTEQAPGLVGTALIVPEGEKYLHNQRLGLVARLKSEELGASFLYWLLNSPLLKAKIGVSAVGQKVRHTSPQKILDNEVCLPPVCEQKGIAQYLAEHDEGCDKLVEKVNDSIRLLCERRSALISAAVTGQIDVRGLVPEAEAA
jgi:type I restriction enzyme S subunit